MLGIALGRIPLHVVHFSGNEALGGRCAVSGLRSGSRYLADFAIEVAVASSSWQCPWLWQMQYLCRAAAVVYTVYQVVLVKEHEGAEDDRLVDAVSCLPTCSG